ncbi:MAG: large conductance mechanosensitive channel protein MscL [Propionibacteriaceae bacterium]|nr:large conductance mechanosensitive channel protein MscL [Propionibacteriaceae bacterium]
MQGFKEFLMRGNLVELAVAVIIGSVFAKVVEAFTKILTDFIGYFGGQPDFSAVEIAGINIGGFINAVITFVITAAVVYFFVVKPYNAMRERFSKKQEEEPAAPTSEELLTEIRDLLRTRNA